MGLPIAARSWSGRVGVVAVGAHGRLEGGAFGGSEGACMSIF